VGQTERVTKISLKEMPKIKLKEDYYEFRSNLHGEEGLKFASGS